MSKSDERRQYWVYKRAGWQHNSAKMSFGRPSDRNSFVRAKLPLITAALNNTGLNNKGMNLDIPVYEVAKLAAHQSPYFDRKRARF